MTANTVNGGGNGAHSGAQTLVLLSAPLTSLTLRTLAEGPKQQAELRRDTELPAQTTLRAHLKRLVALGAIEKRRRNRFPGVLEYELTQAGRDLLFVATVLERWLSRAPDGELPIGGSAAKAAIKALADGWSTTMVRALAADSLSLTELDRVISSLSYPALERRLGAMRLAGLIEARPSNGKGTPYSVTDWLRHAVAPLATAARWERLYLSHETTPIGRLDAEAAFLLSMPLLRLPAEPSGSCRMAVEFRSGNERRLAGVLVEARDCRITTCATRLQGHPDAWALGTPAAWLLAVVQHDIEHLEMGGNHRLARTLLDGLHEALFEAPIRKRP